MLSLSKEEQRFENQVIVKVARGKDFDVRTTDVELRDSEYIQAWGREPGSCIGVRTVSTECVI